MTFSEDRNWSWLMKFVFSDQSRTRHSEVSKVMSRITTSSTFEWDWIEFRFSCTMEDHITSSRALLWVNNNPTYSLWLIENIWNTFIALFSSGIYKKLHFRSIFSICPIIVDFAYSTRSKSSVDFLRNKMRTKRFSVDYRSTIRSSVLKFIKSFQISFKLSLMTAGDDLNFCSRSTKLLRSSQLCFFCLFISQLFHCHHHQLISFHYTHNCRHFLEEISLTT